MACHNAKAVVAAVVDVVVDVDVVVVGTAVVSATGKTQIYKSSENM